MRSPFSDLYAKQFTHQNLSVSLPIRKISDNTDQDKNAQIKVDDHAAQADFRSQSGSGFKSRHKASFTSLYYLMF